MQKNRPRIEDEPLESPSGFARWSVVGQSLPHKSSVLSCGCGNSVSEPQLVPGEAASVTPREPNAICGDGSSYLWNARLVGLNHPVSRFYGVWSINDFFLGKPVRLQAERASFVWGSDELNQGIPGESANPGKIGEWGSWRIKGRISPGIRPL